MSIDKETLGKLYSHTITHGEAWKLFNKAMQGKLYGEDERANAWGWFLVGWISKAKEQDELRNRK